MVPKHELATARHEIRIGRWDFYPTRGVRNRASNWHGGNTLAFGNIWGKTSRGGGGSARRGAVRRGLSRAADGITIPHNIST